MNEESSEDSSTYSHDDAEMQMNKASNIASNNASSSSDMFDQIRKAVRDPSWQATLFCRLSNEEKFKLMDAVYNLKRSGFRTNENQVVRIAVSYLLLDFAERSDKSILFEVQRRLRA